MKKLLIIMILIVLTPTLVFADEVVWSLDNYLIWYSPEFSYPSASAADDSVSIIVQPHGGRILFITDRAAAWMGIDVRFGQTGLAGGVIAQQGDTIIVTGRVVDPDENTEAQLQRAPAGAVMADNAEIDENGYFVIQHTLTEADLSGFAGVIVATAGTEDFYLYNVEVRRDVTGDLNWDLTLPSLAEAFNERFQMGNIWSNRGQMGDRVTFDMFNHHYNTVTASNHHKVSFLLSGQPNNWTFDFNLADAIVDWAEDNDLAMVGHTLVWHSQSQPWLTNLSGGQVRTRAEAIENMHRYISEVAGRYRGRMYSWDVVNEVIYVRGGTWWGQNPDWRAHLRRYGRNLNHTHTLWYDAFANGAVGDECGSDYIFYAFRFARIYDPYAILYYNDYNTFAGVKREAIAQMVEQINERWTADPLYDGRLLIEGIGMQGHYNLRNWPANVGYVRTAIERFIRTGARVSVTELNVYLEGGGIVPTDDLLPELFEEQARRYYELFELFLEFSDYIPRVTSFIWVDLPAQQGAWRRWPHSQHPALFDIERQAKPAFHAVLRTLENAPPANISIPEVVTPHIPIAEAGQPFSAGLNAVQNNHAPIRWHVESGELPNGLRLIAATGAIIGTPTEEGQFNFTVAAENALGRGYRQFTMAVGQQYYVPTQPEEPEYVPAQPAADEALYVPAEPAPEEDYITEFGGGIGLGLAAVVAGIVVGVAVKRHSKRK